MTAYTLTVANAGPDAAQDVTITDALPSGVQFVSAASGCTESSGTVTCALGAVAVGTVSKAITVRAVEAGNLANSATVSSPTGDPTPADHTDDAPPGGGLVYTLRVANAGPQAATTVVVTDTLPSGLSFVSATSSQGGCSASGQTVTCELGTVPVGGSATVTLTVTVAAGLGGQNVHNTAVATSDTTEIDPASNTDDATSAVEPPAPGPPAPAAPAPAAPDVPTTGEGGTGAVKDATVAGEIRATRTSLRLTKTVNRRTIPAGHDVWYTITARNVGRYAAMNVRVCDAPAPNTSYVTVRKAKFSKGRPCWTVKKLTPGKSVTYRVKVRVFGGSPGPVSTARAHAVASNAAPRRAVRRVIVVGRQAVRSGGVTG